MLLREQILLEQKVKIFESILNPKENLETINTRRKANKKGEEDFFP